MITNANFLDLAPDRLTRHFGIMIYISHYSKFDVIKLLLYAIFCNFEYSNRAVELEIKKKAMI